MDLSPLSMCNIQSIDGLDKNNQCDEIVKRVVTQLMTPGSIKVLADNLANGIYDDTNVKEADFLYRLSDGTKGHGMLKSESGTFYIDEYGIAQRFEPSVDNPFIEEGTEKECNYTFTTNKSIRTFVVPKGVKGFVSDFMRNMHVIERGHSHIESLQLPESLQSPYSRQFKDSYIETLRLPKEWRDSVVLGEYNELLLQGQWFDNNKYGYLRWPSTTIGTLEFY